MTRACTLAAVRESLTPEQWARLEAINPHLAAPVAKARARGELVEASAHRDGPRVTVVAKGLRLTLTPNELRRTHPLKEARVRRREHEVVRRALVGITPPAPPWRVVIVRLGPVAVDSDAAWTSAKSVRDEIAAWCGVDDGDARYDWEVRGEVARGYAVRITIEGGV